MKNMDKGLTVPKWVLINWPTIPQMPQNESAQIVCPSPKVWDVDEKRLHWASVVRDSAHCMDCILSLYFVKMPFCGQRDVGHLYIDKFQFQETKTNIARAGEQTRLLAFRRCNLATVTYS
jgi:hypothetical protein